jgi:hypothetical protein
MKLQAGLEGKSCCRSHRAPFLEHLEVGQFEPVVKGHDFSRAAKAQK